MGRVLPWPTAPVRRTAAPVRRRIRCRAVVSVRCRIRCRAVAPLKSSWTGGSLPPQRSRSQVRRRNPAPPKSSWTGKPLPPQWSRTQVRRWNPAPPKSSWTGGTRSPLLLLRSTGLGCPWNPAPQRSSWTGAHRTLRLRRAHPLPGRSPPQRAPPPQRALLPRRGSVDRHRLQPLMGQPILSSTRGRAHRRWRLSRLRILLTGGLGLIR